MGSTWTSGSESSPGSAASSGTMGGSYVGYTQWAQAVGGSKYLTAIAPQVTTPDIYGNWFYIGGALHYGFAFPWGGISIDGHTAQYNTGQRLDQHVPPSSRGYFRRGRIPSNAALSRLAGASYSRFLLERH